MTAFAVRTEQLTKSYAKVPALAGLSLNVRPGSVYGFLGRNGAGKTTTMKILLGLTRPDSGTARVLGFDATRDNLAILERTAFVSERKTLYEWMTGQQFLRFNRGFYPRWSQELADKNARVLHVPLDRCISKLSHGNRTKLCLTAALAQQAKLLILDEPTDGLDPLVQDEVLRLIIEDHVSRGGTVFFSSHHLAEVEQIADWVGIIEAGHLLLEAPLEDIRSQFRLVIASGNDLPTAVSDQVLSSVGESAARKYILTRDAEQFVADLRGGGATVLQVVPLTLREVFLELVRKEELCTSGSCGATAVTVC
jgi:ABC-2 type transport system ATP-binding protein